MSGGSGAYGTWMPIDDFMQGRRRTSWRASGAPSRMPPRMYRDSVQIMREVADMRDLRRGDHCTIAVKVVRAVSPTFDWVTSWLSRHGFCVVYHHFVVLDDVDSVDDAGIPRTSSGKIVQVLEHTNTCREGLVTITEMASRRWYRWVPCAIEFILDKAQCQPVALAEYGDMPCLFLLEQTLSDSDREEVLVRAEAMVKRNVTYNLFTNNCEHTVTAVCTGEAASPQVPVIFSDLAMLAVRSAALACLAVMSPRHLRPWSPAAAPSGQRLGIWAALCYALGGATVAVPAIRRYLQAARSIPVQQKLAVITAKEERYLFVAERVRAAAAALGGPLAFALSAALCRARPAASVALCCNASYAPDIVATWAATGLWWAFQH